LVESSYSSLAQRFNNQIKKEPRSGFLIIPGIKTAEINASKYYMYDHEVSVSDYQEFMDYLKKEQKYDVLEKIRPDSTKWIFEDKVPFQKYFYSNEYLNFPVVCISYDAAVEYCKWIELLINKSRKDSRIAVVRLPTNFEWVNSIYFANQGAIFATGSKDKLINEKQCYLANYRTESQIHMKKENVLIPLRPINSFNPVDGGLYNMAGNVAEMLLSRGKIKGGHWDSEEEDLKVAPIKSFDGPSVYVGFRPVMYYVETPK
jgi:formylglycine-generating enzyme required for sulfatase activity